MNSDSASRNTTCFVINFPNQSVSKSPNLASLALGLARLWRDPRSEGVSALHKSLLPSSSKEPHGKWSFIVLAVNTYQVAMRNLSPRIFEGSKPRVTPRARRLGSGSSVKDHRALSLMRRQARRLEHKATEIAAASSALIFPREKPHRLCIVTYALLPVNNITPDIPNHTGTVAGQ